MNIMEREKIQKRICGNVMSWSVPGQKDRTIAIMEGGEGRYFDLAIHHNGDSQIDVKSFDIWYSDEIPPEATDIDFANNDEVLELVWALIYNRVPFFVSSDHRVVRVDEAALAGQTFGSTVLQTEQADKAGQTDKKAVKSADQDHWQGYLTDLVDLWQQNKSLRGSSRLAEKWHVGGLTKEQFFLFGLNVLTPDEICQGRTMAVLDDLRDCREIADMKRQQSKANKQ